MSEHLSDRESDRSSDRELLEEQPEIFGGELHDADSPARGLALGTRWLGAGLAAIIAVVTLGLALTGRIGLYINPDSAWWAVGMAVVLLIGAVASCTVPLTGRGHHHSAVDAADAVDAAAPAVSHWRGHDHDEYDDHGDHDHGHDHDELPRRSPLAVGFTVAGGVLASVFVVAALVLPPASLSAELALSRSAGAPPQLASSATLELAGAGDTTEFGVGEWASVIATTTDPASFAGDSASLRGFVAPADDGEGIRLARLVVVHCVIDAQTAAVPVANLELPENLEVGQWIEVDGTFALGDDGTLVLEPVSVTPIDEPEDPYEY